MAARHSAHFDTMYVAHSCSLASPSLMKSLHLYAATCVCASLLGCGDGTSREGATPDTGLDSAPAPDAADVADADQDDTSDTTVDAEPWEWPDSVTIRVTLDGVAVESAVVMQGGTGVHHLTDERGEVSLAVDPTVVGELIFMASHPDARIGNHALNAASPEVPTIELTRFDRSDNLEYPWQDPGAPRNSPTTAQCGHCHQTTNRSWYDSPHRTAASNRVVQDLFRGVAFGASSEEDCAVAGGVWAEGLSRNALEPEFQCFVGAGVVPSLNDCADGVCADADEFGACADCHAPAMGPELGGHDLRQAEDLDFRYGVFCDVCHRTESVLPDLPAGAGGRLNLLRPSEPKSGALGPWLPLTFGPDHDSPNPRMGSVQRDHFRDGTLCVGCHELDQAVLVPGAEIDRERWPDGVLPIHSTFSEWEGGPLADAAPCNACHMPPDPQAINAGDLQLFPLSEIGVPGGWYRPAGSVRHHSWDGPRNPDSRMLQLAAAVSLETDLDGGELRVSAATANVSGAHAIPTGEPLRSLLLLVDAECDGAPISPAGGAVVPDFGGYSEVRTRDESWDRWPEAAVGDRLRVIGVSDEFYDYTGFGPFGDGRFGPASKGMPVESFLGEVEIVSVGDGGEIETSAELPEGDRIYRIRDREREHAGRPGFGFARVLVGPEGDRMVPHFLAVDVASDNRLLPQRDWTSEHRFAAPCESPSVRAVLVHRPYPQELAAERGWTLNDQTMVEEVR